MCVIHCIWVPIRKPSSRYEVVQLKKTMDDMLQKVGFFDMDADSKGPTQVKIMMMTMITGTMTIIMIIMLIIKTRKACIPVTILRILMYNDHKILEAALHKNLCT